MKDEVFSVLRILFGQYNINNELFRRLFLIILFHIGSSKVSELLTKLKQQRILAITKGYSNQVLKVSLTVVFLQIMIRSVYTTILNIYVFDFKLRCEEYLSNIVLNKYFKVQSLSDLENVDQHLSNDIPKFISLFVKIFTEILHGIFHLLFYGKSLFKISKILVFYAALFSLVTTKIITKMFSSLSVFNLQERIATNEYQYNLTRGREYNEQIRLYYGGNIEKLKLKKLFLNKLKLSWKRRIIEDQTEALSVSLRTISSLLPILILTNWKNKTSASIVSNLVHGTHNHNSIVDSIENINSSHILFAIEAFNEILFHLLTVTESFGNISKLKAVSKTVFKLLTHSDKIEKYVEYIDDIDNDNDNDVVEYIKLKNLSLSFGDHLVVNNLNFVLRKGEKLLITGPSGSGKSTLLKVIRGIDQLATISGKVETLEPSLMFYLPQSPYMNLGKFKDLLTYPSDSARFSEKQIYYVISKCELQSVYKKLNHGLETVKDWTTLLSGGEKQKISFARLFLHKPKVALLDEATSALDNDSESAMYKALTNICDTFISVGHRSSIQSFHSKSLNILSVENNPETEV